MTPEEIATIARGVLAKYPGVRVALLFGSQVRGTARADSDIDIAVEGHDFDTIRIGTDIAGLLHKDVDVTSLENPPIPLLENIVREGEVIYERSAGDGALWRSRAFATLEIDLPWFDRMANAWIAHVAKHGLKGNEHG